jgi:hypothetical protein
VLDGLSGNVLQNQLDSQVLRRALAAPAHYDVMVPTKNRPGNGRDKVRIPKKSYAMFRALPTDGSRRTLQIFESR